MSTTPDRPRCRFYRPGTNADARWMLERRDAADYRVTEQIEYVDKDGFEYRFPLDLEHNTTDFASIPWFLTWLVPRDGRHTPAAIMHDAFIGGVEGVDYSTTKPQGVSDEHADYLFREAMQQAQVGLLRRWMMWAAVSLRTMSLRTARERLNPLKIVPLAVVVVGWALVAAVLALDVPDFERPGWHLPWFGNRPWYTEIWHGLAVIAGGSLACAVLVALILRHRRGVWVGAISGAIIGFFGLPMIASALGWSGYLVLDGLVSKVTEGHLVKPLVIPMKKVDSDADERFR